MFSWTKKKDATLTELGEQAHAAERELEKAKQATATAQTKFDDDGSDAAAKLVTAARDAERLAGEHLARARRLIPRRVSELADAIVSRHHTEQERLRGPVSDEIRGRLREAEERAADLATQLSAANQAANAIRAELEQVEASATRLAHEVSRVEHRRGKILEMDPADPEQLRRIMLSGGVLEVDTHGGSR